MNYQPVVGERFVNTYYHSLLSISYLPEYKQPESNNRDPIEGKAVEGGESQNASSASREGGHRGPAVLHHRLVVRDRRLAEGFHLAGGKLMRDQLHKCGFHLP